MADRGAYGTLIVRYGAIAAAHFGGGADETSAWEIGSLRKAVGSGLLGIAIQKGRIELESLVWELWPQIYSLTGQEKDRGIRVGHLFNSNSGWISGCCRGLSTCSQSEQYTQR